MRYVISKYGFALLSGASFATNLASAQVSSLSAFKHIPLFEYVPSYQPFTIPDISKVLYVVAVIFAADSKSATLDDMPGSPLKEEVALIPAAVQLEVTIWALT